MIIIISENAKEEEEGRKEGREEAEQTGNTIAATLSK